MNKTGLRCFVSYCREDVPQDLVQYLVSEIEDRLEDSVELLVDQKLRPGANLTSFMHQLNHVDAVIILLSPAYKKKVDSRAGFVYEEFKTILERHKESFQKENSGADPSIIDGYFDLFPILLTGTTESSVPNSLSHILYASLAALHVRADAQGVLYDSSPDSSVNETMLDQLAARIQAILLLKTPELRNVAKSFESLFVDLKADTETLGAEGLSQVFVKTRAFRKVREQGILFLVGRKGTGKSTIAKHVAYATQEQIRGHIRIVADRFDLIEIYSLYGEQFQSETQTIFDKLKCFELAWECFLILCSMDLFLELHDSQQLTPLERSRIPRIRDFLNKEFRSRVEGEGGSSTRDSKVFANFAYAFNMVRLFTDDCIRNSRSNERHFATDLIQHFNRDAYLNFVFGSALVSCVSDLAKTFQNSVLITLDGFDSSFDRFRRDALLHHEGDVGRLEFEIEWLRALLQVLLWTKEPPKDSPAFFGMFRCCATVPKDRFYEVMLGERDGYRYPARATTMDWTGIELAILIRKRLERYATEISTKKEKGNAIKALESIHRKSYGNIPLEISFQFHGREYTLPLFMYVLRHTCWRPREVLLFYSRIISAAKMLPRGESLSSETIRRIVKSQVVKNINNEFISECGSIVNIRDILMAFDGKNQFLSHNDLGRVLNEMDFRFVAGNLSVDQFDEKVKFLFEIGFLGFLINERIRRAWDLGSKYVFYFNEGDEWFVGVRRDDWAEMTYIIHPMFAEYLQIKTDQRGELMFSDWTWDYLLENELSRV